MLFLLLKLYSFVGSNDCSRSFNDLVFSTRKQISKAVNALKQKAITMGLTGVKIGNTIKANGKNYTIIKEIGRGKGGYSYLAKDGNTNVVIKQIHYEPCKIYQFECNKLKSELTSYETLTNVGIRMPKLLYYDPMRQFLIKEYIDGETLAEIVANERLELRHIMQIFDMCKKLYPHLNIDFYPPNFVVQNDLVYYVDYEANYYSNEWNFENWGIYFLANSRGMKAVLENKDFSLLIKNNEPIKIGFEEIVKKWINFSKSYYRKTTRSNYLFNKKNRTYVLKKFNGLLNLSNIDNNLFQYQDRPNYFPRRHHYIQ